MTQQADTGAGTVAPAGRGVLAAPHRMLTLGILLAVGMVAFESMGIATVLPEIARRLDGLHAYGWGLSALMLGQIVGAVVAGRIADRRGPAGPLAAGLAVFALGCALAGAAGTWPLFLLGRVAQGLGAGAVMSMAYTVIALAYPERLRPRMFALLSGAWTVPSLVGPTVAAVVADGAGWRWVFALMLPLVVCAALLILPAVRGLRPASAGAAADRWWRSPVFFSVLLAAGTALFLQALLLTKVVLLAVLGVLGLLIAVAALRRVTPSGTLTVRPGPGAGVVTRFLLCGVYFGSEAFLPFGLTALRGVSAAAAGLGLSAGALTWVAGALAQSRWDESRPGARSAAMSTGWAVLLAGVVIMALGVLAEGVPAWTAIAGWAVGGLGMGLAYNAATTDTMERADADRQGEVSAALQLAQTLGAAVVSGLGGAALAFAERAGDDPRGALLVTFAGTAALSLCGLLVARRMVRGL